MCPCYSHNTRLQRPFASTSFTTQVGPDLCCSSEWTKPEKIYVGQQMWHLHHFYLQAKSSLMKPDAPPWAVALTSNLQLLLQGILAPSHNCKLTWASFQEETVIGCSLWESASGPHSHLSWVAVLRLFMLNNLSVKRIAVVFLWN